MKIIRNEQIVNSIFANSITTFANSTTIFANSTVEITDSFGVQFIPRIYATECKLMITNELTNEIQVQNSIINYNDGVYTLELTLPFLAKDGDKFPVDVVDSKGNLIYKGKLIYYNQVLKKIKQ